MGGTRQHEINRFTKDIVNTIREALLVLDQDFRVIHANKSFYETFQVDPSQTEYRSIFSLGKNQWDIPVLRKGLEEVLSRKSEFHDLIVEHDFPKIGHKVMILNGRQVVDRENGDRLILLAIQDITKEREMLEHTIQAAKLSTVGELSAGIAHGLNSPLTGIYNFLNVYHEQERDEEKKEELALMLSSCRYMTGIIENLTNFSSKTSAQFTRVDLIDVIESTLLFTERQLTVQDIEIIRDFPEKIGEVDGNKSQLQHVFLNVLMNAKEAMMKKGAITVSLKQKGNFIDLEVKDEGAGLSAENLGKVFTPFFTTKREEGGVGLGLSAAYGIIKAHHGNIRVRNEKGAVVTITLPVGK